MSNISAIAVSGMNAAVRRLEVTASNIANQTSTGRLAGARSAAASDAPTAYTPLRVTQVSVAGGGTLAEVGEVSPGQVAIYEPDAPFADQYGMVAAPNVDLGSEMVELIVAKYSFAANVRVLEADDRMTQALLDMTA